MDMRIIQMMYLPEEADENDCDIHVFAYLSAWNRMTPGADKIHEGNIPRLLQEQRKKWGCSHDYYDHMMMMLSLDGDYFGW